MVITTPVMFSSQQPINSQAARRAKTRVERPRKKHVVTVRAVAEENVKCAESLTWVLVVVVVVLFHPCNTPHYLLAWLR